ncbi:methylenetetrahydrofolate reductase, partial [Ancylostoma duodenale]
LNDFVKVGHGNKYVPLHERINRRIKDKTPFFSLEFFPPKTANGVANFFTRLDRFNEGGPLFVDITWHLGSDPANMNKETSSSSIAAGCLDYCRVDTMLHMTCAQYSKEQTIKHLEQSKSVGLRNILALRGDLPNIDTDGIPIYKYRALDMIRWIREEFGDYFTIACSGEGIPSLLMFFTFLQSRCFFLYIALHASNYFARVCA